MNSGASTLSMNATLLVCSASIQSRSSCSRICWADCTGRCAGSSTAAQARRSAHSAVRTLITSPIRGFVILQKLTPDVHAGVEPADDRIDNARRAVDGVGRRMEALLGRLARGDLHRIFVGHPAGVHAVHVNAVVMVVGG